MNRLYKIITKIKIMSPAQIIQYSGILQYAPGLFELED